MAKPRFNRIFGFIEMMMLSEYDDALTLAAVEFVEWLANERNPVNRTNAIKLMGRETLKEMNGMMNWRPSP